MWVIEFFKAYNFIEKKMKKNSKYNLTCNKLCWNCQKRTDINAKKEKDSYEFHHGQLMNTTGCDSFYMFF